MSRLPELQVSYAELRGLVLAALKDHERTQFVSLCGAVAAQAVQQGFINTPGGGTGNQIDYTGHSLHRKDEDSVLELIWDLIVQRILSVGHDGSNAGWPYLRLTRYGMSVVSSPDPTPHDPSGYLRRVAEEVPNLDPVILIYLEESIQTYNIRAILSSTIALGCASEKAILLLIESYATAIRDPQHKARFDKKTDGLFIKKKFDAFLVDSELTRNQLPFHLKDGLDNSLTGIFEMIRSYRNDAGHPSGKTVHQEQAFANLQVFILYLKRIYALMEYFAQNPV